MTTVSTVTYGLTALQACLYFTKYSSGDRFLLKLLVATSVFLDTLELIVTIHATYYYIVIAYANAWALDQVIWSYGWSAFIGVRRIFNRFHLT
jgi:hypothetical protein